MDHVTPANAGASELATRIANRVLSRREVVAIHHTHTDYAGFIASVARMIDSELNKPDSLEYCCDKCGKPFPWNKIVDGTYLLDGTPTGKWVDAVTEGGPVEHWCLSCVDEPSPPESALDASAARTAREMEGVPEPVNQALLEALIRLMQTDRDADDNPGCGTPYEQARAAIVTATAEVPQ